MKLCERSGGDLQQQVNDIPPAHRDVIAVFRKQNMARIPSKKFSTDKKKIPSREFPKSNAKIPSRPFTKGIAKIASRTFTKAPEAAKDPDAPLVP